MKLAELAVLLAKTETTPGTDSVPVAATNGMLAFDININPMQGTDVERNRELGFFSANQMFPTNLYQVLTFDTELVGNASKGVAPAWSPLAKSAGLAEVLNAGTSVVYNPISSSIPACTLYFFVDGLKHTLTYAKGDCTIKVDAHGIPKASWRFLGVWNAPADVANPAPTLTGFQDPQVANKAQTPTFSINGFAAVMRNFEIGLGNQVIYRELINSQRVEITNRKPSISTQIEAEALATFNPFTLALNQTSFVVNLVHGVGAGKITTINAPSCRMQRPENYAEQDTILEWPLKMTPLASLTGNDDFTITLT